MGEEGVNSAASTSSQDVAQASSVTSSAEDACTITSSAPVMIMSSARSSASNVHVVAPNVRSAVAPNLPYVPYDRINLALQQAQAALQVASEYAARERAEFEHMISEHMPHGLSIAAPSAPPMSTILLYYDIISSAIQRAQAALQLASELTARGQAELTYMPHGHLIRVPSAAPMPIILLYCDSVSSAIQQAQAALQSASEPIARGQAEFEHMPHGLSIAVPSAPPMSTVQYTHLGFNDQHNSNFMHNSYLSGVSSGASQQQPNTIDELSNSSPAERTSPLVQQPGQPQAQGQERDTPTQLDQASATSANDQVVRK